MSSVGIQNATGAAAARRLPWHHHGKVFSTAAKVVNACTWWLIESHLFAPTDLIAVVKTIRRSFALQVETF
jgi:hypothetical protein